MMQKHSLTFSTIAIAAVTLFAIWWLNPSHVPHNFIGFAHLIDIILFLLVSYVIWHPIIMEILTWTISSHIKDVYHQNPQSGLKVAFITTIVPKSEPLDLLHKCLPAMVSAEYPHDTWLLDEGNDPEVKKICDLYNVNHFSRLGRDRYNTIGGKFAQKTKGGNHNSWYDVFGNSYDIVAQIDTDFVPVSSFLTKTLGYFQDPKVAFVGTPQVYGNIDNSLIAKGAAEQQYNFYGSILRGLSGMGSTLLIGANHIIRVAALKDINYYSAHITEDLLTGMNLHAKRWKSIYLPFSLAIGEGPTSWESYFNQQMRWAYGCIDILFRQSPKLFRKMDLRRKIYYFFLQQHYFAGIAMAISTLLLSLYFFAGLRASDVDLATFILFYPFVLLVTWLMSICLQTYHIDRKMDGELLFAGTIINIAAWPIWFIAFISVLLGKRLTYKVTPKGDKEIISDIKNSLHVFIPHFVIGLIAALALISSIFTHRQNPVMIFWAFSTMFLMFTVPFSESIIKKISNLISKLKNLSSHHFENLTEIDDINNHHILQDCIFLSLVVISSFTFYITKLGFYSDDWSFLGNFRLSENQSLIGLIQTATTPNTLMRPLQNIYDAILYWLFGTNPLGYHLINAVVLIAMTLMFYFLLRQLKAPKLITLALPVVYILLPNFSTDRFWFASFQANLSIFFYFFSLYAGLRAWKIRSISGLILSALSYEVAIPLFLLNMLLFLSLGKINKRNHSVFVILTSISLVYLLIFKLKTTIRLDNWPGRYITRFPGYVLHIITSAFQTNYGTNWWKIIPTYSSTPIIIFSILLGICIFFYLFLTASESKTNLPNKKWMRSLFISSFLIFILGYAIFFTNQNVGFSPSGIANRVAIAAAIGVACSIVGLTGWIIRSRFGFCILIAVVCTIGSITINTLSTFWISAYEKQQIVISSIEKNIPTIAEGSTIILDGVCPYVGPAIVFESEWDLKGALQLYYEDSSIRADVANSRLQIRDDGIHTQIYSTSQIYPFYPYGKLFIYNYKNETLYPILNMETANYYFSKIHPSYKTDCPPGTEGNGVNVL